MQRYFNGFRESNNSFSSSPKLSIGNRVSLMKSRSKFLRRETAPLISAGNERKPKSKDRRQDKSITRLHLNRMEPVSSSASAPKERDSSFRGSGGLADRTVSSHSCGKRTMLPSNNAGHCLSSICFILEASAISGRISYWWNRSLVCVSESNSCNSDL